MTTAGTCLVEDHGAVRTLCISNLSKRNAFDDGTRLGLLAALGDAVRDPDVRALVLTGAGGTFSAGGDLATMPTEEHAIRKRLGEMHEIARLVLGAPKLVIAAVEGFAVGSGLSVMAACDQVLAARDAQFCASFGRVGLVGDVGLLWTLPRRVSIGAAKRLLLFGEMITAANALGLGLVDEVVDPGSALEHAITQAMQLASGAPLAMAATKRLLDMSSGASFDDLLDAELTTQIGLLASADFDEGRKAFFDRRPPTFTGR